jgi:hypothetical protein
MNCTLRALVSSFFVPPLGSLGSICPYGSTDSAPALPRASARQLHAQERRARRLPAQHRRLLHGWKAPITCGADQLLA